MNKLTLLSSVIFALTAVILMISSLPHIANASSCSTSVDSRGGAASFKSSSSHGGCAAGGASFGGSTSPGVAFADSGGKSHCIAEIGSASGTFGNAFRGSTVSCQVP